MNCCLTESRSIGIEILKLKVDFVLLGNQLTSGLDDC